MQHPKSWLFVIFRALHTILQDFFTGNWLSKRLKKSWSTPIAQLSTESAEEPTFGMASIYMDDQIALQDNLNSWEYGVNTSLREIWRHKTAFDAALLRSDFSHVWYYVIRLSNTPDFLCCGMVAPEYDFQGGVLQDLLDFHAVLDYMTFSLIVTETGGAIIFSLLGDSNSGKNLVRSLHSLSNNVLPDAIVRLTFEHFQNVYASPNWWDGLDETVKRSLLYRQMTGTVIGPERTTDCLLDDGLRTVNWSVVSRETNLCL